MDCERVAVVPGKRLSIANEQNFAGAGTYERSGYIYSSLAGFLEIIETTSTKTFVVHSKNLKTMIPTQGDIVTAKVITTTPELCRCSIYTIGPVVLTNTFRAVLRKEDVRATKKDEVEISECFSPGDIIFARVLPIIETNTFHLSTAENQLGVVLSQSKTGHVMTATGWTEMQCPKTLRKYSKKVAKEYSDI